MMDEEGDGQPNRELLPWDVDGEPNDAPAARVDAFGGARKRKFLKALSKSGCLADACRLSDVSRTTVYRHRERDAGFAHCCELAIKMSGSDVELLAWERGVLGVEEEVVRYGKVHVVRKRSDSILRLLVQGANRKKYGPNPGFSRKRLLKHERDQLERQVREEIKAEMPAVDDTITDLREKLRHFRDRQDAARLKAGYTKLANGDWVPPGWVRAEGTPESPPPFSPPYDALFD